jgi:NADH-quinone oxidoreductase subunit A
LKSPASGGAFLLNKGSKHSSVLVCSFHILELIFITFPMSMEKSHLAEYLPIALMLVFALGFVVVTMLATHYFGPKRNTQIKGEAFECGIESRGNARIPFNIKYFLVAILFVLFDVEVIFMYPWAVNFKELGVNGFIEMVVFIVLLMVGFFYIKKKGALKWED